MHVGEVMTADVANGEGMRVSVFVSGCRNHCKGCFQPQTWDFNYGREYTPEIEQFIIDELSKSYYDGITILGGDPMEPENQEPVLRLLRRIKKELPERLGLYRIRIRPGSCAGRETLCRWCDKRTAGIHRYSH